MSLYGVIKELIESETHKIYKSCIAEITSIDKANMRCNVVLKVKRGNEAEYLPMYNLPILYATGKGSTIMMPLEIGDTVLVVFTNFDSNLSLIDHVQRSSNVDKQLSAVVIGSFVLNTKIGQTIYGDEVNGVPAKGIHIVSDEAVRILAPCIDIPSPIMQGSDEGEYKTSSNSYIQTYRFNFNTGPWKYLVAFSFEVANEAAGRASLVRVQRDDTDIISEGYYTFGDKEKYILVGGIKYLDFSSEGVGPNAHYIDFDFARDSGGTAMLRRIRIVVFKVIENTGCPVP